MRHIFRFVSYNTAYGLTNSLASTVRHFVQGHDQRLIVITEAKKKDLLPPLDTALNEELKLGAARR